MTVTIDIDDIKTPEQAQEQIIYVLNALQVKPEEVVKGLFEYYNLGLTFEESLKRATE